MALVPALLLYALIRKCKMRQRRRILLTVLLYAGITLITNLVGDQGFYERAWLSGTRAKSIAFLQHSDTAEGFCKRYADGIPGSIPGTFLVDGDFRQYSSGMLYVYPDKSWIVIVGNNPFSGALERLRFNTFYNVARDSSGAWLESYSHFSLGGHMKYLATQGSIGGAREYLARYGFKSMTQGASPTR